MVVSKIIPLGLVLALQQGTQTSKQVEPKITKVFDGCNTTTYIDGQPTRQTLVYCIPSSVIDLTKPPQQENIKQVPSTPIADWPVIVGAYLADKDAHGCNWGWFFDGHNCRLMTRIISGDREPIKCKIRLWKHDSSGYQLDCSYKPFPQPNVPEKAGKQ